MYNQEIVDLVQEMLNARANNVKQELIDMVKYQPAHGMTVRECSNKVVDILERMQQEESMIKAFDVMRDRLLNVEQTPHLPRD